MYYFAVFLLVKKAWNFIHVIQSRQLLQAMETQKNPQIMTHVHKSVNYTLFDAKFVPRSARFVCLGSYPKGTGAIQVYEITHKELQGDVKLLADVRGVFGTVF